MGGGIVKEAGYANTCKVEHVESLINENTAALLYIKSHHCVQKGIVSIKDYVVIGKKYDLPVIIDAAGEEDLTTYYNEGADCVIYSGTKALEGPTSALVIGRKEFIKTLKNQSKGIGRVMKVCKENILGLTKAIELYVSKTKLTLEEQRERLTDFNNELNSIEGITSTCVQDPAGRAIIRALISFDEDKLGINAIEIAERLKSREVRIYTRDYRANEGKIEIDIRDLSKDELEFILTRIKEIVKK